MSKVFSHPGVLTCQVVNNIPYPFCSSFLARKRRKRKTNNVSTEGEYTSIACERSIRSEGDSKLSSILFSLGTWMDDEDKVWVKAGLCYRNAAVDHFRIHARYHDLAQAAVPVIAPIAGNIKGQPVQIERRTMLRHTKPLYMGATPENIH